MQPAIKWITFVLKALAAVTLFDMSFLPQRWALPLFIVTSAAKEILLIVGDYLDDGKRNNSFQMPLPGMARAAAVAILCALMFTGCARFQNRQTDTTYGADGKPTRSITTAQAAYTIGPAKSDLTKFKATNTDKSQSATVGALSNASEEPVAVGKFLDLLLMVGKAGATGGAAR